MESLGLLHLDVCSRAAALAPGSPAPPHEAQLPRAKTALPSPQHDNEGEKDSSMAKPRKIGYRIAHFGDLHLGSLHGDVRHALAMVDDAVQNGADHLVFSGDILDDADAGVLKCFVREL